jgi:murein DD-endopeptidase MepM/ murein hydrolase activator NlpD
MKGLIAALLCVAGGYAFATGANADPNQKGDGETSPFPLQLEVRAPFAPTAFPSGDRTYVAYELYLTNFSSNPIKLSRIDVLDAQAPAAKPIASFADKQLSEILQSVGAPSPDVSEVGAGATVIAFIWVSVDRSARMPVRLRNRVSTTAAQVDGIVVDTNPHKLRTLSPPVTGADWLISDGPSNDPNNHHRRGILAINGQVTISRRFAIDWMVKRDNALFSGDPHDLRSYYAYGQPVSAVSDAVVEKVRDGIPNNTPGPLEDFHRAVPMTMETIGGNTIVLNLGHGEYAWYFHLAPGSIRVKAGEHVHRGQRIASIGCSGDPNIPHLHFEVTTSSTLLAGEGLPYVIDHYRVRNSDKGWERHSAELPLDGMVVSLEESGASGKR